MAHIPIKKIKMKLKSFVNWLRDADEVKETLEIRVHVYNTRKINKQVTGLGAEVIDCLAAQVIGLTFHFHYLGGNHD